MEKRPATVTLVGLMMFLGAVGYAVGTVVNIVLVLQPEEAQQFFSRPISDWYFIINGALDAVLAVGFVWIGRLALRGDYGAGMTVTMLAVINLVFSFFNLAYGYGFLTLAVAILVLVANNTSSAQRWYRQGLSAS